MGKPILLNVFAIMAVFVFYAPGCVSQDKAGKVIDTLSQSSKVIESDLVLDDFIKGKKTTRVIVTLLEPPRFRRDRESGPSSLQWSKNFKDPVFREELRAAVRSAQKQAISRLDPDKVQITNRFVYVFGFSAEVTLKGLKQLEELDEVISVSKDRVLKAQ